MKQILFPWSESARGSMKFYDPLDPVFFMNDVEREQFEKGKNKGAPIGLGVLVICFFIISVLLFILS